MSGNPPTPTLVDRLRYRVHSQFTVVVGVLVVVALLSAYVAVGALAAPSTTTEERQVARWSANGSFDHQATVQNASVAFPRGETLKNRLLYFTHPTPILEGTYTYEYDGDAEAVDVQTDLRLVVQSIDRSGDRSAVYWNVSEPLTSAESDDLGPNEAHTASFSVNVSDRQALATAIEEQLGASPGSREVLVVAETTGNADLEGDPREIGRTDVLRIEPVGTIYRVRADVDPGDGGTVTEAVEVPTDRDPLPLYGAPLLAVLALAGALGLVSLERGDRLAIPPGTRKNIERDRERGRFEEWISAGRTTIDDDDRVVEIESLEDLVDVAIDANERVVYDAAAGWYLVLDGDVVYRYDEGESVVEDDPASGSATEAAPTDDEDE